ncbi:MAG: DUF6985 domain-containing protein [Lysinibacillus sp.]
MIDQLFGELQQEDDCGWWGKRTIDFSGKQCSVDILIHGEEITQRQEIAFACFMEKWTTLQEYLIGALIKYYNEEERFCYGPEDEDEMKEWWPEIETKEALLQAITLETIVVAWDFAQEDKRSIYLLFSRTWGGADDDDNGIGVHYVNEEIDEIGYKDMAF